MPINIQREQIDHMIKNGVANLRGIDPDIPFLKVFDRMVANGISEEVAIQILWESNMEDIAFVDREDLEEWLR